MDWHKHWLKDKQAWIHTAITMLLAVLLLLIGERTAEVVGNVATLAFYYPFTRINNSLTVLTAEEGLVDNLNAKLTELSVRLQQYNEAIEENRRLRALLGFIPPPTFSMVPAEIIEVTGEGVPNTVIVNLGSDDSIQVNQTVINQNGVVGRVARVMKDYSVVYLMTEPRCRVAARIIRSREQGIIRFQLGRGMYLDNLPRGCDVVVGDTVITSGLGGIFPEGLVIGVVAAVNVPEREFFYDISVKPAVNFNGLDELYILIQGD